MAIFQRKNLVEQQLKREEKKISALEAEIRRFEEFWDGFPIEKEWRVEKQLEVDPLQFAEWGIRVYYDGDYHPFRLHNRPYLIAAYIGRYRHILWKTARQVEKSTFLGNRAITSSCLSRGFRTIYVSPSNEQTKTFSRDRLDDIIYASPEIHPFVGKMNENSLYLKRFQATRSVIMLYYAYHDASRLRGKFADELQLDEFQDLDPAHIPIMQACLHHSKIRREIRCGTPLSLDNNIEIEWRKSKQCEWVVPCFSCGVNNSANPQNQISTFWQILDERNISKNGVVCRRCHRPINPLHPKARWIPMHREGGPFWGFHITQLMAPWIILDPLQWADFFHAYENWGRTQFRNERLGISDDSATRPITKSRLKQLACGADPLKDLEEYKEYSKTYPVWMGIDWAPGDTEDSFTVITLATLKDEKFDVFYVKRCTGPLTDPKNHIPLILDLYQQFNVRAVGCDYGMGHDRNRILVRNLGILKVKIFQYVEPHYVIQWSPTLGRFLVNKPEVFDSLFAALRDGYFRLPQWTYFANPYAQDILNVFAEEREGIKHLFRYSHSGPDDTWHSIVFCFLASFITGNPRFDILFPTGIPEAAAQEIFEQ